VVVASRREGFALDQPQRLALSRLADVAAGSVSSPQITQPRRLYLWGPVGRGKTWLLDAFFEALPIAKRRSHFQRFFREFHAGMAGKAPGRSAIAASLEEIIGDARVFCFDEFYAHEPGDATLLTRVLEELVIQRDLAVVVTSNYAPEGLLPDVEHRTSDGPVEVSHRVFERGIALINEAFEVVAIDAGIDYRQQSSVHDDRHAGFRAGAMVSPGTADQLAALGLAVAAAGGVVALNGGRRIRARGIADAIVRFDFEDLCNRPVSAADVVGIANRYTTWVLHDVPRLSTCSPEAAQRFVNLIDVLHDMDVRLVITTAHPPGELLEGDSMPPDAMRARSRLSLLKR